MGIKLDNPSCKKTCLMISYEDYITNLGGTNKVALGQIDILKKENVSTIFICPFNIGGLFSSRSYWLLRVDKKLLGVLSIEGVIGYLKRIQKSGYELEGIILHHLRNINVDNIDLIFSVFNCSILVYIHDYYMICPNGGGNLLKNGKICGTIESGIAECANCDYFGFATVKFKQLFDKHLNRIMFVAPSNSCKHYWICAYPEFESRTLVLFHQVLEGESNFIHKKIVNHERIRVGFVGSPTAIKGWEDFKYALERIKCLEKYYFFHFGKKRDDINGITNVFVDFHSSENAMVEALKNNQIDVALLLSKCPETYCYTYYESIAAGCYIVSFKNSGNIADQIYQRENGIVLNNIDDLISLFNDFEGFKVKIENCIHNVPNKLTNNGSFIRYLKKGTKECNLEEKEYLIRNKYHLLFLYEVKNSVKQYISKNKGDKI